LGLIVVPALKRWAIIKGPGDAEIAEAQGYNQGTSLIRKLLKR